MRTGSTFEHADPARLDAFTRAYIEAALWSSIDDREGVSEPMDENFGPSDLAPATRARVGLDCRRFFEANEADILAGPCVPRGCSAIEQAGHDFWLTRGGHGAGFWDGDWPEPASDRLTAAADEFGSVDWYVGDDGRIYQAGAEVMP